MFLTGHHKLLSYPQCDWEKNSQNSVYACDCEQVDGCTFLPKSRKKKETQIYLSDKSWWGLDQTQPSYQSVNKWILHHPGKILLFRSTGLLWYPLGWDKETHSSQGVKSMQQHNLCRFPRDTSRPHRTAPQFCDVNLFIENCQCFRAVPWHPRIPRTICMDVSCVCPSAAGQSPLSVPEVKLCHCWWMSFSPEGTSSCFLFWTRRSIHLLAFPAPDTDFLSWHQYSTWHMMTFPEMLLLYQLIPK